MSKTGDCLDELSQNWHKSSSSQPNLFKSHKDPTQPSYSYVRIRKDWEDRPDTRMVGLAFFFPRALYVVVTQATAAVDANMVHCY